MFGEAPLAATLTGGIIVFTAVLVHMLVSLRGGRALVVKES